MRLNKVHKEDKTVDIISPPVFPPDSYVQGASYYCLNKSLAAMMNDLQPLSLEPPSRVASTPRFSHRIQRVAACMKSGLKWGPRVRLSKSVSSLSLTKPDSSVRNHDWHQVGAVLGWALNVAVFTNPIGLRIWSPDSGTGTCSPKKGLQAHSYLLRKADAA